VWRAWEGGGGMPVYEYTCLRCGHCFEQRRKATDPPASRCPECRGKVKRVYQPVGIIFRGSGFHVTDYGRSGDKPKTETEKSPAAAKSGDS
jgi:putative FmdB family regulatory protein